MTKHVESGLYTFRFSFMSKQGEYMVEYTTFRVVDADNLKERVANLKQTYADQYGADVSKINMSYKVCNDNYYTWEM